MNSYRHLTIVAIIVICAVVFGIEQSQETTFGDAWGSSSTSLGVTWEHLRSGHLGAADFRQLATLVTYTFLHGDIEHIVYNMVFLWLFGILACELLGQWPTLVIYFVCGIGAAITQALMVRDAAPAIGASGAISGLEGLYLGLALRWQLPDANVWPLAYPVPPMQVVALGVIGFCGDLVLFYMRGDNIAHGAHMGGLLTGVLIAAMITSAYPTLASFNPRWRGRRV
ncbi:MAG: rhomboid family intramembrane serine protease [Pirellulales bacterium]